jgi:hypothetical protein
MHASGSMFLVEGGADAIGGVRAGLSKSDDTEDKKALHDFAGERMSIRMRLRCAHAAWIVPARTIRRRIDSVRSEPGQDPNTPFARSLQ